MGPLLPLVHELEYELLEPMLLDIWDIDIIDTIQADELDIELLLASYNSNILMLVMEFLDLEEGLIPVAHAAVVRFDINKGRWILLDFNQEEPLSLDTK